MTRQPSFWERRLAGVKQEAEADIDVAPPEEAAPQTDEEILAALELPDPDTMAAGDDFAAFMAKAVPQHIRNRALRKLWRSNPVLACLDGLNDYDDDYLTGSTGNGPIQTTYQVGKGLLAHVQEMARQQEMRENIAADNPEPEPEAEIVEPEIEMADVAMDTPEIVEPVEAMAVMPRRMRFAFEGDAA